MSKLETIIDEAWDARDSITTQTTGAVREAVDEALSLLDSGQARVASPSDSGWHVHQWLKKAVLLSFRLNAMEPISGGVGGGVWYDKVKNKFDGWNASDFEKAGLRTIPGSFVRYGSYISPSAVLMPSFINLGAYVGKNTMIDSRVAIGSCAQIGAHCHISDGVGIGGVLEPLQADPVIVEDNVFIGAHSEVVEGVIIEKGSVLSMGVCLGASTKIVDRESGDISYGRIPAYSVVVPGTLPSSEKMGNGLPAPSLSCAVIVKRVDERTRSKTSINELLRD